MTVSDFNKLEFKELCALPGIGKSTAKRIAARRDKYKFYTIDDLLKIKGLGKITLAKLGIEAPKKSTREKRVKELERYVSNFTITPQQPFKDVEYNSRMTFFEDIVKDTCHQPQLVRSASGCNTCRYALLCQCHLRNFVSERGKRNKAPTKKVVAEIFSKVDNYYYFKLPDGSVNKQKVNLPIQLDD
jgi:hypothetical protein